jgi:3'-5' exonuclease
MKTLVIDIETTGQNFDTMDEVSQHMLTRWIDQTSKTKEEYEVALKGIKEGLGFSPLTGEIVAIGMEEFESEKRAVYYQDPKGHTKDSEIDGIQYRVMDEKTMLSRFWDRVQGYDEVVTFNGFNFDMPYIIVRSAIHSIRPSCNLMVNRYASYYRTKPVHMDLQDLLSFYGAMNKKGSLHMWCRAFGIESPKASGVSGDDVAMLWREEKYFEIAAYNALDIKSTSKLWGKYLQYFRV